MATKGSCPCGATQFTATIRLTPFSPHLLLLFQACFGVVPTSARDRASCLLRGVVSDETSRTSHRQWPN
jgi:hypothetical protein